VPWWKFGLRKPSSETQIDSELRFHFEKLIEEKLAAGFTPDEARRQAILEFGSREQLKEEVREVHRMALLDSAVANVRSGFRLIRKSPAFAASVIITLGLGIGANSAVFSAIDAILLRPLPFPNSAELVMLHQYDRKAKNPETFVAPVRLQDWNRLNSTLQAISGWYTEDVSELSGAVPEKVTEALVAPRFLQVWGVSPALGRDFSPREEHFGGPDAVLISDRFWRSRFHADPKVLGKRLRLDKYSYTVIGVMPASFAFPDHDVDVWCPSPMDAPFAQSRESTWFTVIGRLKPDVTLARAQANLASLQAQLGKQFPKTDGDLRINIQRLKESTVGGVRRSLWVLFGSVSLLLLIACANIAALLLARAAEREREMSVRFSLGASRAHAIAQLLTECFVLALTGSVLGLLMAMAGSKLLRSLAQGLPRAEEITLDWRIVLYTLGCAVLATLLCGLFPAFRATSRGLATRLAQGSRSQVSARNPLQWLLVGIQVALAVTLLVGAGLLLRSFQELARVTPGFEISHVLVLQISGNWGETADMKKLTTRMDRTLDELRVVPGVRAAATSAMLPGMPADSHTELKISEGRADAEDKIVADSRFVSNGYFGAMQIPLLAGESCRASLNNTAVVNRSFAAKYFGASPAVGHHVQFVSSSFITTPAEIRGIVADAREQGLNRDPEPTVYWCVSAPDPSPYFLIRTQGDPMKMADTLRQKIRQIEPARSVFGVSSLQEHLSGNFAEDRIRMLLLTLFAVTAVSLACIGLYGTLSYFVAVRRKEIGLRLALGAIRTQIIKQFLVKGLSVTLAGCLAGLFLAVALVRGLSGMLYGVSRFDPTTFCGVVCLMFAVATLASLAPSIRAARFEPMEALRDE
jgi:predicted permease